MPELYPAIQPHTIVPLAVDGGHTLHVERCGRVGGIPVVFLHGGPGAGCKADHRQFFSPERYDVVLFDQRGAGRSQPFGGVDANDTWRLVADLEHIRAHFGIERWVLFGGSWGAALALAYAETHPARVLGMVLRGSFLARERDWSWFAGGGAHRMLPVQWQRFQDDAGVPAGCDLIEYLHGETFSGNRTRVERVTRAWEAWSGAVVMFSIDGSGDGGGGPAGDLDVAIGKMRLEMHYARHRYFLDEGQLLRDIGRLPRVPVTLIHGARDLTCTADAAWTLHRAIPESRLEILRNAGHISSERPMTEALVRAADDLAALLGGP